MTLSTLFLFLLRLTFTTQGLLLFRGWIKYVCLLRSHVGCVYVTGLVPEILQRAPTSTVVSNVLVCKL